MALPLRYVKNDMTREIIILDNVRDKLQIISIFILMHIFVIAFMNVGQNISTCLFWHVLVKLGKVICLILPRDITKCDLWIHVKRTLFILTLIITSWNDLLKTREGKSSTFQLYSFFSQRYSDLSREFS